ncbi:hypothetical protein Jiend_00380 [Micromonospora endophytica]|nr:hypothetical protein Jiend_00380 [Micromonospora endophytica]
MASAIRTNITYLRVVAGWLYLATVIDFADACQRHGIRRSMGRIGSSYDNALADAFFASLKRELDVDRRARDADKLECLVQAVEYRHQGIDNVLRWIDSSRAALSPVSAQRLAHAALTEQPLAWLTPARQIT